MLRRKVTIELTCPSASDEGVELHSLHNLISVCDVATRFYISYSASIVSSGGNRAPSGEEGL